MNLLLLVLVILVFNIVLNILLIVVLLFIEEFWKEFDLLVFIFEGDFFGELGNWEELNKFFFFFSLINF